MSSTTKLNNATVTLEMVGNEDAYHGEYPIEVYANSYGAHDEIAIEFPEWSAAWYTESGKLKRIVIEFAEKERCGSQ